MNGGSSIDYRYRLLLELVGVELWDKAITRGKFSGGTNIRDIHIHVLQLKMQKIDCPS